MTVYFVLIALIHFCVVQGEKCGGVLEGDYGNFRYDGSSKLGRTEKATNCIWVIQVPHANKILFTVNEFRSNSDLLLYPGEALSECVLSKIRVSHHTSFSVLGGTLIALLPDTGATVSFTWETEEASDGSGDVTADFIESTDGQLGWVPQKRKENFLWVLQFDGPAEIEWNTTVRHGNGDSSDLRLPCNIFTVCIIEVAEDSLMEVDIRICRSSVGKLDTLSSQVIFVGSTILPEPHDATVEISWVSEARPQTTTDYTTTTTTTSYTTTTLKTTPWTTTTSYTTTPTTTDYTTTTYPTTTTKYTTTTPTTTDYTTTTYPTTTTKYTTTTPTTTDYTTTTYPTTTTKYTTTIPTTTFPTTNYTTTKSTTTYPTTTTNSTTIAPGNTTSTPKSTTTSYITAAPAAVSRTEAPGPIRFTSFPVHNTHMKRKNPCARNLCSHSCVPTARSFQCFCPNGMWLDFDGLSCLTYNPKDNQI